MSNSRFSIPDSQCLLCGKDDPEPEKVLLRAGPLSLIFEAGDLRYVKLGEREIIRRIYAAVRDHNWGTVPAVLSDVKVEAVVDSFRISYTADHHQNEIQFAWRAEVTGETDGTIRFHFDGQAKSTFLRNRIGFCVLHPIKECAGAPCRVEYADGSGALTVFPKLIAAAQPVRGFQDLRLLAHEVAPGLWAEVRFEGDAFEMEDQRNWIDASFKTFCTPLRIPYPVEVKAGTRIRQSVTLRLLQSADSQFSILNSQSGPEPSTPIDQSLPALAATVHIEVQRDQSRRLPRLGLNSPSHRYGLFERNVRRLEALNLAHTRLDLRLNEPNWQGALGLAAGSAKADSGLELALHFPSVSPMLMKDLARELANRREQLVRIVLFQNGTKTTPERLLTLARKHFDEAIPGIPIGTGTNADFYQLNVSRPPQERSDFICWSMNPQSHAFDNASLSETPEAVADQVESAREYFPDKPLVISPITLKPRFNAVATAPELPARPGELPPQVDPRQMSLFGAGWTLAMIKHLAEAGVDSVTMYETTGWRGVMETEAGSPLPEKFRSIPGAVFPLYHVLADAGDFVGGKVIISRSSDPLKVEILVLRKRDRFAVLLANLTGQSQRASVHGLSGPMSMKRLDETNAEKAMIEPEEFRAEPGQITHAKQGRVEVELKPCAIARLDCLG